MKTYLLLLMILSIISATYSTTIKVPEDYPAIQQAINAAQEGDTVLVARGTYAENINFRGKGIVLTSYFILTQDPEDITSTIIDGSQSSDSDTASCVLMYKPSQSFSDDSSAALLGFTLTGGTGTKWNDEHNPGSFYREGGGILIQYWAPRIRFNIIKDNDAYDKTGVVSAGGGAIRCGDGNPLIENNILLHNSGRYGGGIVFNYSGGVIRNNVIAENYGGEDYAGGGLWILGNRFDNKIKVVENNTIINNSSVLPGGGIFFWASSQSYTRNNIIWGNVAPSSSQIRIQGGTVQIMYNDVEGGYAGEGNIEIAPDFDQDGYYLSNSSPCIDAGKDSVVFNDREDPMNPGSALWPSQGTIRNDMGAFGGPNCVDLPLIITSISDDLHGSVPVNFNLFQNFPNPFNPTTNIRWESSENGHQTLKVYDILGNEVANLLDNYKPAGKYEVTFNASKLSSGIYFYQLNVNEFSETKEMILLK